MSQSRRNFVKTIAGSSFLATAIGKDLLTTKKEITLDYKADFNGIEDMNIAGIGMGIMGFNNCRAATSIKGVNLIATCDLYQGRLDRSKEVFGKNIYTTRNYQEILSRNDINAVIISTADHWHNKIAIAAMNAGKHVYLEKPIVHHIEQGMSVVNAEKSTGKVVQIGSQGVSSLIYQKAKEIYKSGELGKLVMAEASFNRQSSNGAWQYSIPTDASEETIDWSRFLGDAPKIPFNKEHFFRWRNFQEYGTGVAGDLFVHLFSGMHVILSSLGPNKIFATGGLRYWNDGRNVPDVMLAVFDYPKTESHEAFNLILKVNFIDGGGEGGNFKLMGTEGVLEIVGNKLMLTKSKMSDSPTYGGWDSFDTFTEAQQKEYVKWFKAKYPNPSKPIKIASKEVYKEPNNFDSHKAHYMNFFNAIMGKEKAIENSSFGLRAAAPSLAANKSYFESRPISWDPVNMKLV